MANIKTTDTDGRIDAKITRADVSRHLDGVRFKAIDGTVDAYAVITDSTSNIFNVRFIFSSLCY
jgi:hypothetical protein